MERRAWILGGTLAVGGAVASGLFRYLDQARRTAPSKALSKRSGPLLVPEDFHVTVLSRAGQRMSDGTVTPHLPDGMACFEGKAGEWILARNHELSTHLSLSAYPGGQPKQAYDQASSGGVSRLVLDPKTLSVKSSNMLLTGTERNCGGGPSPWGFITCEESTDEGHGYAFLCDVRASTLQAPQRLKGYGRFRREAAAVDPDTHAAYLTEDMTDACLYRFTPHTSKAPFEGRLEALRIVGAPGFDTSLNCKVNAPRKVDWVPVKDPDARILSTREQAYAEGAARFNRLEGIWLDGDGVVFSATSGGKLNLGQIFRLSIQTNELSLIAESEGQDSFAGPDNLTVAPNGDIVFAEDGPGPQHLRGLTVSGRIYSIARNALSNSEIAGVCFSPDGRVLFCNLQADGVTLAIRGPFERLRI